MESRNIGSKLWVEWNGVIEEIADGGMLTLLPLENATCAALGT